MPASATAARHNLPVALTSFVGRRHELERLLEQLDARRLVTVAGVGGCGKTRLVLRAADELAAGLADGPWLVDLSTVEDPADLPRTVASTLDLLLEPGSDPAAGLSKQLAHRETVLVLDTCEHLLAEVAELAEQLVRSCPRLTVVATSREPLGVEGESVWWVPGLGEDEARQLFTERAELVAPRFDPSGVEDVVDAVCAKVDRLPLGIELAAAWARVLGPAQIASGLDGSIQLLSRAPRRTAPRHQTLHASVQWSHDLLEPHEQAFFRRLSAFAGTFTIDAMAEVCGGADGEVDGGVDWLDLLGRLLDKSLVTVRDVGGEMRYALLDTIRQYAGQALLDAGEREEVLDRHLGHFLRVAEEAEPGLDVDQDGWRRRLDAAHDNLVAALRWGLGPDGPEDAEVATRRAAGCRLAAALSHYWFLRGVSGAGLRFQERALSVVADPVVRHRLLAGRAALAQVSGRFDLLEEAVDQVLSDPDADPVARARCQVLQCYPMFFVDFEETERLTGAAGAVAEAVDDRFYRDWALAMQGYAFQTRSLHERALATADEVLRSAGESGDRFLASFALGIRSFTAMVAGDVRAAVEVGEQAILTVRPLRDYYAVGTITVNVAHAVGLSGDLDRARMLIDPVVGSIDESDDTDVVGFMVADGLVQLWSGDVEAALRTFERGTRRRVGGGVAGTDWISLRCLPGLAGAQRRLGRTDEARATAHRGIELARRFRTPYEEAQLTDELAMLTAGSDRGRARELVHRSLALRMRFGLLTQVPDSLEALAGLEAEDRTRGPLAVRLLSASESARARMGCPVQPVDVAEREALRTTLRDELGEDFDAHWSAGRELSTADAVSLAQRGRGPRDRPDTGWESLSPTEREVADLVSAGLTNPEVAARLFMSRSTVKAHLSRVYQKLGVANRTELAVALTTAD